MKFENDFSAPGAEHDWLIQIGDTNGKPFCIKLRWFTRCGFRLTINFNTDRLIKLFGFNHKIIEVGDIK